MRTFRLGNARQLPLVAGGERELIDIVDCGMLDACSPLREDLENVPSYTTYEPLARLTVPLA